MKKLFSIILLLPLIVGCRTTINNTFVQAVAEHRQDTTLVNGSIIATCQEGIEQESRIEVKEAYQEIIDNLTTISRQSEILEKYVLNQLSEEELMVFIRSKWRAP